MGLQQTLSLLLDGASAARLASDMARAGAQGADALQAEVDRKMADTKYNLAGKWIDEKEFRASARRIADAATREILPAMQRLRDAGQENTEEYRKLVAMLDRMRTAHQESTGTISKLWQGVKTHVLGALGAMAAAFSIRAMAQFSSESVRAADQAEQAWRKLRGEVRNVGESYDALEPSIRAALDVIGERAVMDTDDLALGLARMVAVTKNTKDGLEAVGLAADFSRKKGVDFQTAVEAISRALTTGRTMGLEPYLGALNEKKELLPQIRAALEGLENPMTGYQRASERLKIEWGELKEAWGAGLIKAAESGPLFQNLTGWIKSVTAWLKDNQASIVSWGNNILNVIQVGVIPAWGALVLAFNYVKGTWYLLVAAFFAGVSTFRLIQSAVQALAAGIELAQLKLLKGLEWINRTLGYTKAAESNRQAIAAITASYNELSLAAARNTQKFKEAGDTATEYGKKAGEAFAKGTEAFVSSGGKMVATIDRLKWTTKEDFVPAMEDAGKAVEKLGKDTKAVIDAIATATAADLKKFLTDFWSWLTASLNATKYAFDTIQADIDRFFAKNKSKFDAAHEARIKAAVAPPPADPLQQRQAAEARAARIRELDAERQQIKEALAFGIGDVEEHNRRLAEIDEEQTALRVANVIYWGEVAGATAGAVGEEGEEAADKVEAKWEQTMQMLSAAVIGFGRVFGGVFEDLASATAGLMNGFKGIEAGLATLGDKAASFGDKLTGALAVIGGGAEIGSMIGGKAGGILGGAGAGIAFLAGASPLGIAAVAVGGGILGSFFKKNKDPERMATNEQWYQAALRGDEEALANLYRMSGRSGERTRDGKKPEGWATSKAKDDAWKKYQAAQEELEKAELPVSQGGKLTPGAEVRALSTIAEHGTLTTRQQDRIRALESEVNRELQEGLRAGTLGVEREAELLELREEIRELRELALGEGGEGQGPSRLERAQMALEAQQARLQSEFERGMEAGTLTHEQQVELQHQIELLDQELLALGEDTASAVGALDDLTGGAGAAGESLSGLSTVIDDLLAQLGGLGAGAPAAHPRSTDARTWNVEINMSGLADAEVPARTIEAINTAFGAQFHSNAALQGNAALPS